MNFKETIERLRALGVPDVAIPSVMEMLDDSEEEGRRPRTSTERSRAHRERVRNENATISSPERAEVVPETLQIRPEIVASALPGPVPHTRVLCGAELSNTLEASASKGADAPSETLPEKPLTPDSALFRRSREVFGDRCGGQITKLKKLCGGDVGETRQIVEQAALADKPLEYLAAILARSGSRADFGRTRGPPLNGRQAAREAQFNTLSDIFHESDDDRQKPSETPEADASGGGILAIGWAGGA